MSERMIERENDEREGDSLQWDSDKKYAGRNNFVLPCGMGPAARQNGKWQCDCPLKAAKL